VCVGLGFSFVFLFCEYFAMIHIYSYSTFQCVYISSMSFLLRVSCTCAASWRETSSAKLFSPRKKQIPRGSSSFLYSYHYYHHYFPLTPNTIIGCCRLAATHTFLLTACPLSSHFRRLSHNSHLISLRTDPSTSWIILV